MLDQSHKDILEKTKEAKLSDTPISAFMNTSAISLRENYSVKTTIDTFNTHHISGAPIVNFENKIIGVISEYDLLIEAASKPLSSHIEFKTNIISVNPETTLKELLLIFYKQKLKWLPVVNKENYLQGVVSRMDLLNFIASQAKFNS
jgi:predicted transcriptional regulator